jgi:hypothetical protein
MPSMRMPPFDRFDHVIDGETGDGYRGQRFHLDAGLARHLDPRSRITQSSGVSGSASTFAALPLIVNDMDIPFSPATVMLLFTRLIRDALAGCLKSEASKNSPVEKIQASPGREINYKRISHARAGRFNRQPPFDNRIVPHGKIRPPKSGVGHERTSADVRGVSV